MRSHVTRTPQYAGGSRQEIQAIAAEAFHTDPEDLQFVFPKTNSSLQDFVYEGFLIRGVLAAAPNTATGERGSMPLVFVDPRHLGLSPFFVEMQEGIIDPRLLVEHLGFRIPHHCRLCTRHKAFAEEPLQIIDGDTVELFLVPRTEELMTPVSVSAPPQEPRSSADGPNPVRTQTDRHGGHTAGPRAYPRADPAPPEAGEALGLNDPEEVEDDDQGFFRAGFLVFIPRYQPEVVEAFLGVPCDIEFVLQVVDDARRSDTALHFDRLIPAIPQPDSTFGAILAVPSWASDISIVLVDLREIDGRLFAFEIRGRLNKASLLQQVGLSGATEVEVLLHGRVLDPHTWQHFLTGDTIRFFTSGARIDPPIALEDMLNNPAEWTLPCPEFSGPHPLAFLVLTDAWPKVVPIDPETVRSSADFKQEASRIFGYSVDRITTCPAIPRLEDLAVLGQKCKTALVATEAVSKIPIPPGKYAPKQHVILLDARPLLRDVSWTLAPHGCIEVSRLAAPFQYIAPPGLFVNVTGAPTECRGSRTVINAGPGTVLRLVHVLEEADASTHGPDDESEESSSANSVSSDTPADTSSVTAGDRQTQLLRPRRSRSPRRHVATNGNWVAGLGVACLTLSTQPTTTDAAGNGTLLQAGQVADPAYSHPWDTQLVPNVSFAALVLVVFGLLIISMGPRLHKVLQEPRGRNASEQAHLDTLRSLVGALGGQWMPRLPFTVQHLAMLDLETEDDEHNEVLEEAAQVCCVILAFDFAPAVFSVDLQLPATTEELLAALQPLRDGRMQSHFPHLLPVLPQPRADVATFIAAPHWCPFRHGVCFDCSRVDNRTYSTFVPEYVNLEEVLHIANFPENLAITVWIGPDLVRLEHPGRIHTFPGMLFSFLHEGDEPVIPVTLGQLLQFRSWDPPLEVPEPFFQDAYCLVYSGPGQLFFADPTVPMRYRHRIAEATGANPAHMRLYACEQRPRDAAINGVPCTTIIAVGDRRRDYVQPAWHMALLDCRFIEMGWHAVYVTSGTFDIQKVLDDFDSHAPLGWHTILLGDFPQTGRIAARPGQIFVLAYAAEAHQRTSIAGAEHGEEQDGSFPHVPHDEPPNDSPESGTPGTEAETRTDDQNHEGDPVEVHCLTLMPEYAQEHVVVPVVLPASVDAVLQLVDQVRDAQYRHLFGRLIPVDVQPALGAACILAVPAWTFEGVPALFVSFAPPVRVFALVVPASLSAEGILRIVGANAHMQVFVRDVPWALPADASTPVRSGDLFTVFPIGHPYIPPITLASMLRTAEGWHDEPVLPRPPSDGLWLLTELSSHHFRFQASPEVSLRVAVERHLGCAPGGLEVLPATPAIRDHSRRGLNSRQVYAALPHDLLPGVPFILDLRPTLLEIAWVYAPAGRIDVAALLERHRQRCPESHFLRLFGGYSPPGHENHERYVHPGQVLTLAFWKRREGGGSAQP